MNSYFYDLEVREGVSTNVLLPLTSFVCWCTAYLWLVKTFKDKSPEWCGRMLTLLHGSLSSIFGFCLCNTSMECSAFEEKTTNSKHYCLMLFTWGYFAFDLIWCLIYWEDPPIILVHHISALLVITRYLQRRVSGSIFSCGLAALEITNPCLQTRWFLRYSGYGHTRLFRVVEIIYMVSFVVVRAVYGTIFLIKLLHCPTADVEDKIMFLLLYGVSLGLIYDLYSYVCYKLQVKNYVLHLFHCLSHRFGIVYRRE